MCCALFCHSKCFFCHSERSFLSFRARARNPVWMLRFVQHDKRGVIPSALFLSFRTLFFVIPSACEESSMDASLRLRSVQHDKRGVIPSAFFCHSERSFLSFRAHARNPVWMLHFACAPFSMTSAVSFQVLFLSFRALFFVIPNAVRNPVHGCFASFSMTSAVSFQVLFFVIPSALFLSFRARARNPVRCGCFTALSMTRWWMLHSALLRSA